ncbi:MAG TPA: 23S rRNA (pseudouridine(1915)-N(3))-methyltransferase RlmH [Saprospiraceae bacterium]|nr:23S rRNA (pseudouridine(1915)-N(3))-methyltransferase RlmH [Saprospiraceae bacterium]
MKINILAIGKTSEKYLLEGIDIYVKRLKHYTNLEIITIADVKAVNDKNQLKEKEGEQIIKYIKEDDFVILCDERGQMLKSHELADLFSKKMVDATKRIIFIIGAFGVSLQISKRADLILSLSKMTFSHQMIRLFLVEQIYRGFTIIKNEKYHNE